MRVTGASPLQVAGVARGGRQRVGLAVALVGLAGVWLTLDRFYANRFSWAPGVRPVDGPADLPPRLGALLDLADLELTLTPSVTAGSPLGTGIGPAPLPRPAEPTAELAGSASSH
jgi:hypothetical protein